MRQINKAGLDLIKSFEGLYLKAYLDIVGVATIGYGCTEGVTKDDVKNGRTITEQQAVDMMMKELTQFQNGVTACVKSPINDNQFAALVSFSYNLGLGSLQKSTLLKLLNAGNTSGAADEFLKWDHAGGKQVAGLTRRRQAERSLFLQSAPLAVAAPPAKAPGLLPDGPTDEEINKKLADIEKDLK